MENEALRLVRVFHNLNRAQVADRVDLSPSYISELESGSKKVTLEVLNKYSAAFKIPVSSLMLFAEKAHDGGVSESARVIIGGKVVKMLNWLATITQDEQEEGDVQKKTSSALSVKG